MSVLIRGMEMPTNGHITITLSDNGEVVCNSEVIGGKYQYRSYGRLGKAVPVPPHGRLIDADNIGLTDFEIILCQKGNPFKNALEMLLEKIENAPTIIPEEEGE